MGEKKGVRERWMRFDREMKLSDKGIERERKPVIAKEIIKRISLSAEGKSNDPFRRRCIFKG